MHFPFSFVFSVPGIVNPFAPVSFSQAPGTSQGAEVATMNGTVSRPADIKPHPDASDRRTPVPIAVQPQTLSRKRGWAPSVPEPSMPRTILASPCGYLDTPAEHRDFSETPSRDELDMEGMVAELPPPKRRRTFAGSIVSTALSAALIGTAVGLTVYRLWRGRGKQPEPLPPPPYEQGEWVPPSTSEPSEFSDLHIVNHPTPMTRKPRHVAGRRSAPRQKKTPSRASLANSTPYTLASPPRASIPPEFNFNAPGPSDPVGEEDQMDWMSAQLAKLIEEGKKALQKEVVVMSEAQEDEEDDGSGMWEDEGLQSISRSRSGSIRGHKRPRRSEMCSPPPSYVSPQTTPRKTQLDDGHSSHGRASLSHEDSGRRGSVGSTRSQMNSYREDESWQSPELRETMERARRRILEQRHQVS